MKTITFKPEHGIFTTTPKKLTSETDMIPNPLGPNPSSIFTDKSASLSYYFHQKPTKH